MWGVFVLVPRVALRAITTCTWVLRRGSRIQNSTEGPKVGPRANGASSKHSWKPKVLKPKQMRTTTEKAWQDNIANKKPKERLLNKDFHYSTTGSGLKHNNFNQKLLKHTLFITLLTSALRQITNNDEFVETKKELTLWERVSPMRHAWGWEKEVFGPFYGARSVVRRYYGLNKTF